ncbi:MAG: type II toxin-antitoxin system HicB family antitoxin [Patescibacteria group bacterium]
MKQTILRYDALFEEQSEGGYTVTVPALQGCISEGDTFEEAKANIAEAIQLYIEDLAADGEKIPEDTTVFIDHIKIATQV